MPMILIYVTIRVVVTGKSPSPPLTQERGVKSMENYAFIPLRVHYLQNGLGTHRSYSDLRYKYLVNIIINYC